MDCMEVTVWTCICTEIDGAGFLAWQDSKHPVNMTRLESGGILSVISEQQINRGIRQYESGITGDTKDSGYRGWR